LHGFKCAKASAGSFQISKIRKKKIQKIFYFDVKHASHVDVQLELARYLDDLRNLLNPDFHFNVHIPSTWNLEFVVAVEQGVNNYGIVRTRRFGQRRSLSKRSLSRFLMPNVVKFRCQNGPTISVGFPFQFFPKFFA
jgi:hypothetical protein